MECTVHKLARNVFVKNVGHEKMKVYTSYSKIFLHSLVLSFYDNSVMFPHGQYSVFCRYSKLRKRTFTHSINERLSFLTLSPSVQEIRYQNWYLFLSSTEQC
jgi:hypothetical protein